MTTKEIEKNLTAKDGTIIDVWVHAHGGWKWSEDAKCYIYVNDFHNPPSSYCLGERMIHADFGKDSYGVIWRGSTDKGWHDFNFEADLTKAINWIQNCQYPELKCRAWGTEGKGG